MFDPHSDETTGYHLFLEPEGDLASELQSIIKELASTRGGPVFPPHVTLLAQIEAVDVHERARELATSLQPFQMLLGSLAGEDEYFRAFYIRMEDTDAVIKAHESANHLFGMEDARPYLPHISLLYGSLPEQDRAALIRDTVYPKGALMQVSALHLYETRGKVQEWRKVAEYPFGA
jgi:2'-5' RNA ligase